MVYYNPQITKYNLHVNHQQLQCFFMAQMLPDFLDQLTLGIFGGETG